MMVLERCWKPPEIVKIELTRVILCFLPSCLDLNATLNRQDQAHALPSHGHPRFLHLV
jgi:hypothetical protein